MRIERTEHFRCPVETLWDHINDPQKQKLWMKGVLSNEPTGPGPRGVGSTSRMVIQEGRKKAEYQVDVTAYERPHHMQVVIQGGNFPPAMTMLVDYRLVAQGPQTRLEYACAARCEKWSFLMRLMLPLIRLFGQMQLKRFMKALRKLVEAPPVAAA